MSRESSERSTGGVSFFIFSIFVTGLIILCVNVSAIMGKNEYGWALAGLVLVVAALCESNTPHCPRCHDDDRKKSKEEAKSE